ncbi:NUDIX domain-containing protein [Gordonia sp. SID5947]|uniref:NUDIX domain-containing protein n=1 Tax=Gordonia sp. SID5947 TaxID=2690315 RepID=UPI001367D8DD|nr:NUDIX domain-containing protein [Gordonia sp. SID5947]
MSSPAPIVVSGVVIRDRDGLLLTVRKRGTQRFMLPGGKPEPGESAVRTAVRECAEEVGLAVDEADLYEWGRFRSAAANEAGCDVIATVFECALIEDDVSPAAEIDEVRWLNVNGCSMPDDLAPLVIEHVIPALRLRGHDS